MNVFINSDDPGSGVVTKKSTNSYDIQSGEAVLTCTLSTKLKRQSDSDPVAVGDVVRWNEALQISEVLPRRNQLSRRSAVPMPGAFAHEQVIAANVDRVIPVFAAANPRPAWHLLDRYLVSAESAEIPGLVVITKMDLVADKPEAAEILSVAAEYQACGYQVILTSAETGAGLDDLRAALCGGLSVFVGKSGVGKTSLLNAIEPGLGLRVQATNQTTGKGRHTTTHMQIFQTEAGAAIVDTPGIREFGLWGVDSSELAMYFPEMRGWVGKCKFGLGCRHDQEPGCEIRLAVGRGEISPYRYQSYLKLKEEP
ncbi:MAG: ribosome small subunit-dependent GTPase A [Chloroflexi bacterium HGW-Chloroflexi-6]|nr:MAG: ribosome small subunit-dependent GTPase A [Chloroflexi bacterium HGW-Chloroflexi-6]